jgi:hypothetical protein
MQVIGERSVMARPMPPEKRVSKARELIKKACEIPVPNSVGWEYFSYTAQVKDTLKQAFELVKLINHSPSTPDEVKAEARAVIDEIAVAEKEILKASKKS